MRGLMWAAGIAAVGFLVWKFVLGPGWLDSQVHGVQHSMGQKPAEPAGNP